MQRLQRGTLLLHLSGSSQESLREREMSDFIDALNLITSHKIHELYARQDTEDPLVLRKKVRTENTTPDACGVGLGTVALRGALGRWPRCHRTAMRRRIDKPPPIVVDFCQIRNL